MRITRLGYWLSIVVILIAVLALNATDMLDELGDDATSGLVSVVVTATYLAVAALRMRDMRNNPWWYLTSLIPESGLGR